MCMELWVSGVVSVWTCEEVFGGAGMWMWVCGGAGYGAAVVWMCGYVSVEVRV